MMESEVEG